MHICSDCDSDRDRYCDSYCYSYLEWFLFEEMIGRLSSLSIRLTRLWFQDPFLLLCLSVFLSVCLSLCHHLSSHSHPSTFHPFTSPLYHSTIAIWLIITHINYDRLAGLFSQKDATAVDFSSFQMSRLERDDISSNRSSFKSENTSNTGLSVLSVLTDADDKERKYSIEFGENLLLLVVKLIPALYWAYLRLFIMLSHCILCNQYSI